MSAAFGRRALGRLAVGGALLSLAGCARADLLNATVSSAGWKRIEGLKFGAAARQALDVYVPAAPDPSRTVVVFFYGGGWNSGERRDYLFVASALASAGYLTVVPDYRLVPEVRFPAFVEDNAAAVRWVQENVATYGGDPKRIVLVGHSAGAYNAALLAAEDSWLRRAGADPSAIVGVVSIAGTVAELPGEFASIAAAFGGATPEASVPALRVKAGAPPALFLHGADDGTVYPRQSERGAGAWRAAGVRADLKLYPGVGHVGIVMAFAGLFRKHAPTLDDTLAFIRSL